MKRRSKFINVHVYALHIIHMYMYVHVCLFDRDVSEESVSEEEEQVQKDLQEEKKEEETEKM